jgi:hypothetical protein
MHIDLVAGEVVGDNWEGFPMTAEELQEQMRFALKVAERVQKARWDVLKARLGVDEPEKTA